jgi:hypothetical protein
MVMSGGTNTTPLYLVIENSNITSGDADGIKRNTSGHIVSEGEYNKLIWNTRTSVGKFTFPIGKTDGTYIPFVFDKKTTGTESGTGKVTLSSWYTANNAVLPSAVASMCPHEDNATDRFWQIDISGYSANPSSDIDFYYATAELDGIAEADLAAQRWNSSNPNTCKWDLPVAGTVNTTNKYVRVTSVTSFSPWTLTNRNSPLPVELISFTAICDENNYISLDWETAAEVNSDFFAIEKSNDGIYYEQVEKIQAAGNSNSVIKYQYTDKLITGNIVYYRLKQVDFDGKYEYLGPVAVEPCSRSSNIESITAFSSDNHKINVIIGAAKENTYQIVLYDALGRNITNLIKLNVNSGTNYFELYPNRLAGGVYHIQVFNNEESYNKKVFIR